MEGAVSTLGRHQVLGSRKPERHGVKVEPGAG